MTNGEVFDDFLNKLLVNSDVDSDTKILCSRLLDKDFHFAYIKLTTILRIRFPEMFDVAMKATLMQLLINKQKDI